MYKLIRALLFQFDGELSHQLSLYFMRLAGLQPLNGTLAHLFVPVDKPVEAFGLKFSNPVGLAAGYDKNGVALAGMAAFGFGHLEIGTVTPRPQPGNPKPRVFRLPEDQAVINRMGFSGEGAAFVEKRLQSYRERMRTKKRVVIGVNLGKNKDTLLENAAEDYVLLMHRFTPLADYLTINISSPNTVGLRRLQGREMLESLLGAIARERENIVLASDRRVPILVKLAPDLLDDELDDAVAVILDTGMDGIVATNTTLSREGLRSRYQSEAGGLSGKPLRELSDLVLSKVVKRVGGKVPVVGVGGIMSPADARRKLDLGATLVQIYTGMVYAGPGLVKDIVTKI